MADTLFLTSVSGVNEEIFMHSYIQLFFHIFIFYHISTVKSQLSLAYYISKKVEILTFKNVEILTSGVKKLAGPRSGNGDLWVRV